MSFIEKLTRKYIVYCPKCDGELNWYSLSSNENTFKCINCNIFLSRKTPYDNILETVAPKRMEEYHRQRGMLDEEYEGIPTSVYYKPRWIKVIEKITGK